MNTLFARIRSTVIVGVVLSATALGAQTVITPSKNNYTPAQDVELGRQAAAEVEQHGRRLTVRADRFVLSAGAINSALLLQRSASERQRYRRE